MLVPQRGLLRRILFQLWLRDARRKLSRFEHCIGATDRVLDIGSGSGSVTCLLRRREIAVTPVDVRDLSLAPDSKPQLYDGRRLPFEDDHFDTALILTVLHHVQDVEQLLREARRVARRIIVIEDIYAHRAQRWLTCAADSLMNLEFRGHPHNNRSDAEWKSLFDALGLSVIHTRSDRVAVLFRQATYVLCRNEAVESERHQLIQAAMRRRGPVGQRAPSAREQGSHLTRISFTVSTASRHSRRAK